MWYVCLIILIFNSRSDGIVQRQRKLITVRVEVQGIDPGGLQEVSEREILPTEAQQVPAERAG